MEILKSYIKFWDQDGSVRLDAFLPSEGENLPALLILPGGAYFALSDREGASVAEYFAGRGFASFVLRYSTLHPSFDKADTPINPHTRFPEPLQQTAFAIKLLRDGADRFRLNKNRISLMGFSAGGHLAANYCNYWTREDIWGSVCSDREEVRPNASILCYPAVNLSSTSATMNLAVFGPMESYPAYLLEPYCAAKNIDRCTPPTFIWHNATDKMVNVSQSYEMACALAEEGIIHELHVFSEGDHATGLSEGLPARIWKELAISFIERNT